MKGMFGAYAELAMGHDELAPASGQGRDDFGGIGATLIDSLDTLWIMGLREEYEAAVTKLKEQDSGLRRAANGELSNDVSVFETNIRVVGGLLSAYDLSGDKELLDIATSIASRLEPAFNTPSGVPRSFVNLHTGSAHSLSWTGGKSILADFGTMHLEWATLSQRTGDRRWGQRTATVFDVIRRNLGRQSSVPKGLYPVFLYPDTGSFSGDTSSFGALGDSFYEYLVKCWRSLDFLENRDSWRNAFDAAVSAMRSNMLVDWKTDSRTGDVMSYVSPLHGSYRDGSMEHLACFVPGMLVLGADDTTPEKERDYLNMARRIARTCVEMYKSQPTGLSPDNARFSGNGEISAIDRKSIQRPETVESLFYLYRRTGEEKYREWAWDIFSAMEKHYSTASGGWQGIIDATSANPTGDDKQQSFLLAETMKYMYLIFSDADDVHLDEWVFNTEAHPVKITRREVLEKRR